MPSGIKFMSKKRGDSIHAYQENILIQIPRILGVDHEGILYNVESENLRARS